MKNKQRIINTTVICICLAVTFLAGYFLSVIQLLSWDIFISKSPAEWFKPQSVLYFDTDEIERDNIAAFNRVRSILGTRYYEQVDINEAFSMAIKGLSAGTGDPYTVYYTPEEMQQFMEKSSGNYVGIGISVHMDENQLLTVADIFPGSPAKEAGIKKNDKIIKVNNEDVTSITDADLIVKKIRGEEGTKVRITVYRPESRENIELELVRRSINIPYIASEVIEDNIGYIRIKQFDNDIAKDFENELNKLVSQGIKGLIIDLRDNPGGDYSQVVKIADMIVPKGLIVYTENRYKIRDEEFSDDRELNMPLSILINGYSASASEILAACVQDYGKGTLVGKKTFGKGLVQAIDMGFPNGGGFKYTVARYFTPSGKCIHGEGVSPDIEVELDEKFNSVLIEDIPREEDTQLQVAIEEVLKNIGK
ncbi:MAG: S41 family peptidase [Clostridiaceae bacterium]|nr:S41 family peptidase [Clostridiaceae bacterium]